ncbi:uncharacterized protein [Triticum aestivum]|uniref:uncharacterized protein isoform X1 n=1 Tax=Triticum aestivum TaxID=4565 RepID=UPI00162ECFA5|nr:uncharacterized protein LOC123136131 isoform X1 [Triticum aestivum]XP_044411371.1 uncharacterized protein LOC123136131 isoform X1 [Triticum aestivum]XP_044411372.1 uncharacterized protein LOC123136131 isoform X1 [Triticum aestivum]XP_044411373.1 uncharacterized protein LOC123136131 isoform X1 [Triticum aestivum]XP_044411374.1 uncharacterized protein LOC123136131 isoform X1 [Triticum aestivum]
MAETAAAAESDSGSEVGPTGDSAEFASPVKARKRAPESEAGTSATTASESSETRVDDGNIQEAESSLREGLSLNYELMVTQNKTVGTKLIIATMQRRKGKESGKACEEKAPENTDAKEENSDDAEELKVSDAQGSGLLSVLDRMLTDKEYRCVCAQVQRKGVEAEGYAVEGISVGGHKTCITVPSLNVAFDIGRGPLFAVRHDHLFITHAHLDHIVHAIQEQCWC